MHQTCWTCWSNKLDKVSWLNLIPSSPSTLSQMIEFIGHYKLSNQTLTWRYLNDRTVKHIGKSNTTDVSPVQTYQRPLNWDFHSVNKLNIRQSNTSDLPEVQRNSLTIHPIHILSKRVKHIRQSHSWIHWVVQHIGYSYALLPLATRFWPNRGSGTCGPEPLKRVKKTNKK